MPVTLETYCPERIRSHGEIPVISMLHGITVYMYFMDGEQHELPHLHATCRDGEVVVSIPDGNVLEGNLPVDKMKCLQDWTRLHGEELMKNWEMVASGEQPYKIEPLDFRFLHLPAYHREMNIPDSMVDHFGSAGPGCIISDSDQSN